MTIATILQNKIKQHWQIDNFVIEPAKMQFGDLAVNAAFILAKQQQQPPLVIAEEIAAKLAQDDELSKIFAKIEAVKPGYVNFYFSDEYLRQVLTDIISDKFGLNVGQGRKIVIEYSSPNTNKPLHLGHLRNDALGMSLANILSELGFEVVKTSVINDRGIHIMQSLLAYLKWGEGKTPEQVGKKGDKFVGDFYVKFHQEAEKNPALKEEAAELLRRWEAGDEEIRQVWQQLNEWVFQGWRETYELYGSEFDKWYYESDLYDKGKTIIKQAADKGVVQQRQDGAYVIDLSEYGLGSRESGEKVLLRPDGTTVYITQDIYLAIKRYEDFGFDQMIYVVASEQEYHFKVLFTILDILGVGLSGKLLHFSYGMVNLPEGKMKSRQGKVVDADDLIAEMIGLAAAEVEQRTTDLSASDKEEIAKAIALAAIKYWFLRANPKSTLTFNPQKSLDFEGDTGPYLLYSYVRLRSILRKAGQVSSTFELEGKLPEAERNLLRQMARWPFVLHHFMDGYNINLICSFLNELASSFNSYYHSHPVLQADDQTKALRLQLISAGSSLLKKGLKMLNIKTVERM